MELELYSSELSCLKVEVAVLPIPNNPYGLCGRKTTLNLNLKTAHPKVCLPQHNYAKLTGSRNTIFQLQVIVQPV